MNNEFKAKNYKDTTIYVLESATGGGTSAGSVATVSKPLGKDQLVMQSRMGPKETPKPRNFVAKNAKMGGAGQHKDKKKAEKQGDVKHRKPFAEGWKDESSEHDEFLAHARQQLQNVTPVERVRLAQRLSKLEQKHFPEMSSIESNGISSSITGMLHSITDAKPRPNQQFGNVTTPQGSGSAEPLRPAPIQNKPSGATTSFAEPDDDEPEQDHDFASWYQSASDKDKAEFQQHIADKADMTPEEAGEYLEYMVQHGEIDPKEWKQMKATEFAEAGYGRNRGYAQGFASPTAPSLGGNNYDSDGNQLGGGHDEYPSGNNQPMNFDRPQIIAWWFFDIPADTSPDEVSYLDIKKTKSGKWGMPQYDKSGASFRLRMRTATEKFGQAKKWVPKNESVKEAGAAKTDDAYLAYLAKKKEEKNNNWHPSKHVTDPQKKKELAPHDKDVKRGSYADRAAYLTKGGVSEDHSDMGKGWGKGSQATAYKSTAESNHPDEKEDKALIRKMVKQKALKQEDGYMAELSAKLAEKIPANAPVDRWIKDFDKASKTPNAKGHHQFKNKNKDKVRQMAIAASYGAKNPKKKK